MYLLKTPEITDPKTNLAIEEFAVRNLDVSKKYLFIYLNSPSVIIGKNQNPFEEVNISFVNENNIEVVRRISGGGAVYHESGNINFCFITENTKESFNNYTNLLNPVVSLLNNLGVKAEFNDRNDLVINDKKISGNAQFTSRKRLLSHGTLLFDASLENVSNTLNVNKENIKSKSTKSVRSKVTNISDHLRKPVSVFDFRTKLTDAILTSFSFEGYIEFNQIQWAAINELASTKFNTWDWNWGRTPQFTVNVEDQIFKIKLVLKIIKGVIAEIEYLDCENSMKKILDSLLNIRFTKNDIQNSINNNSNHLLEKDRLKLIDTIFPY